MAYTDVCKKTLLFEGERMPCLVGGQELIILWPYGGEPRAYDAACPHGQVSLARGDFNGRILNCPAHGWVFNGHDGASLQPCGWALKEFPLRIVNGMVQVDVPQVDVAAPQAAHV